jgi:hypothetical protein
MKDVNYFIEYLKNMAREEEEKKEKKDMGELPNVLKTKKQDEEIRKNLFENNEKYYKPPKCDKKINVIKKDEILNGKREWIF